MIGTTTMAAAPVTTYAAAPTAFGTTTMAAPVTYAAPYTTQAASYVAAPTMAAPVTTAAASYVAAPQAYQYAAPIVPPAAPMAPAKLTQGIPTPEQIASQKTGYAAALDKQLKEAIATVQKETSIEKDMVKFNSEKAVALFNNSIDERLAEAIALAEEQATIQSLELKKALIERNLQLDAQASGLVMDYNMKSLMQDCAQKQYAFQTQYVQAENRLAQDFNKQVALANQGTKYAPTAPAVR
jgi:hypothetical protein